MQNYHGVVQSIVMIGDGEYRVTFRAYDERNIDAIFCVNEDVPFKLYSMIACRKECGLAVIPEGTLTECINVVDENETIEMVPPDDIDKWKIGSLAREIALSLSDGGLFTTCNIEEDC